MIEILLLIITVLLPIIWFIDTRKPKNFPPGEFIHQIHPIVFFLNNNPLNNEIK